MFLFHKDLIKVASFTGVCTVLKDGILYCKALSNDACPVEAKSLAEITSIGSAVVVLLL
jgi:hypothetical protein